MSHNLLSSRWAPRSARTSNYIPQASTFNSASSSPARPLAPGDELSRIGKLYRRLRWKSQLLLVSYAHVAASSNSTITPIASLTSTDREAMFKLDFFEYYALLERMLLHLLAVFDIKISPHGSLHPLQDTIANGNGSQWSHRFHENVLEALDQTDNPLNPCLGHGDVRRYLGIAKESRNRWKDGEEEETLIGSGANRHRRMLQEVDLEVMVGTFLMQLDVAILLAAQHVTSRSIVCGMANASVEDRLDAGDVPVEAMVDAMEWE